MLKLNHDFGLILGFALALVIGLSVNKSLIENKKYTDRAPDEAVK